MHLLKGSGSDPTLLVSSTPPIIEQPVPQDDREMLLTEDKKKHLAAFKEKVLFHLLEVIIIMRFIVRWKKYLCTKKIVIL